MRRILVLVTAIWLGCAGSPAPRIIRVEQGLLPDNVIRGEARPVRKIAEAMESAGTPAVSVAVINDYAVEWARGYGATPDTLFQAASISKSVTAFAAMRLVEQGLLGLDEDVNRRLRSWKVPDSDLTRERPVTVRGILSHTAGFDVLFYEGTPAGEPVPTLLQILRGEPPSPVPAARVVYAPGTKTVYSGYGFLILQQLIIDVTGRPFPEAMDDLVFRPLGMSSSTFRQPLPRELEPRAVAGTRGGEPLPGKWLIKPGMASGGLWSTPTDLARFAIELQKARLGRSRLLRRATAEEMIPPAGSDPRGLGLVVRGDGNAIRFSHGGFTSGYRSELVAFGDGRGVIVMTNGSSHGLIRQILRSVAVEYGWTAAEYLPKERTVVALEARELEPLAGEYEFPEGRNPRVSVVKVVNGQLHLDGTPLRAESPTSFFGLGEATLTFVRDEAGVVKELVYDAGGMKLVAKKIR